MSDLLRGLGLEFGSRVTYTTTFADDGLLPPTSPLRRAWAHWQPTVLGLVAGSLRLLRDPYVVLALTGGDDEATQKDVGALVKHLQNIYSTQLAAIFGDYNTATIVRDVLEVVHRRRVPAKSQPEWFIEAIGGTPRDFVVGEPQLKQAVQAALLGAVTRAHLATGVLIDGQDGSQYAIDANKVLGRTNGVELFDDGPLRLDKTPYKLQQLGGRYADVPLMGARLLERIGIPQILGGILATEVAPGVAIKDFAPQIIGLAYPDDRAALGLSWPATSQEAFQLWADNYSEMAGRAQLTTGTPAANTPASAGAEELNATSYFAVATGRFQ